MLAAVLAAGTLVSCGDDSVRDAGKDGRRGSIVAKDKATLDQGKNGLSKGQAKHQGAKNQNDGEGPGNGDKAGGADGDGSGSTDSNSSGTDADNGSDGTPTQSKPAKACSDDFSGDMEGSGSMPSYADLERGCVREDGSQIVLTATTVGALPARMPDQNTNLAIAFALTPAGGRSTYVQAEASYDGWTATISNGGRSRTISGPTVNGDQLILRIPASELGADRVTWNVESSWLKSTLTSTQYAFDDAPNGNVGTFDRG